MVTPSALEIWLTGRGAQVSRAVGGLEALGDAMQSLSLLKFRPRKVSLRIGCCRVSRVWSTSMDHVHVDSMSS